MSYEVYKKNANNKSDWKLRLEAVEGLKNIDDERTIDILKRLLYSDKVFPVKEAALRALQTKGVDVKLPKKKKGHLIKDVNKKIKIVKNKLPEDHTFVDFKIELKKYYPVIYDTYQGDKGSHFDKWLGNVWKAA